MRDISRGRTKRAIDAARRLGISGIIDELRARGLAQSSHFVARNARYMIADTFARRWDRKHNVDTAGSIQIDSLSVVGSNAEFGNECLCTSPNSFDFMIRSLSTEWAGYTFVDIGAGKSRTLLLASRYNFARIIGVEFAKELVDCARKNIAQFRTGWQKSRNIEIVLADATEYALPDGPLLLYFYNPFARRVFEMVLRRLESSLPGRQKPCYLIYATSSHNSLEWAKPLILQSGKFEEIPTPPMPFFWDAIRGARFAAFRTTSIVGSQANGESQSAS